jgi:hypothetical protein
VSGIGKNGERGVLLRSISLKPIKGATVAVKATDMLGKEMLVVKQA